MRVDEEGKEEHQPNIIDSTMPWEGNKSPPQLILADAIVGIKKKFAGFKSPGPAKKKFRKFIKPKVKETDKPCHCGNWVSGEFKNVISIFKIIFPELIELIQVNFMANLCDRHKTTAAIRLGMDTSNSRVSNERIWFFGAPR